MADTAVVYTHGDFKTNEAKTSHGLIRGSERYDVKAIIDPVHAGKDAGELLDGQHRGIPILPNVHSLSQVGIEAQYFIIGIANIGGILNREWFPEMKAAMAAGMGLVNGMHEPMVEIPEISKLASLYGVPLVDIRLPRKRESLHFWTGEIAEVECPIVPVLGVDCAVGKRTTARMLVEATRKMGKKADMIYTGQTGWMQGWKYGFILDSTLNDFVCGELEHAILNCWREEKPDIIYLEGQAALRNPSGPCGAEFIISGNASSVVLVYPPGRTYHKGWDHKKLRVAPLDKDVKLIDAFEVPLSGIALNTKELTYEEAKAYQREYEEKYGVHICLPIEEGVEELARICLEKRK